MALGDERRASGESMAQQRRATGKNNEAQRRAIGKAMEESRRGASQLAEDINRLVVPPTTPRRLRTIEPRGVLPTQRGTASSPAQPIRQGGGIASPLTERTTVVEGQTVPDRDYWPAQSVMTSDGLLMFQIKPIKTVRMQDANGDAVAFNYALPPVTPNVIE
jgi:hypothetical protein